MIVDPDFVTHWKTKALANALGDMGSSLQALLLLWSHCQSRGAWQFQLTPLKLAGICGFTGNAQVLWDAMLELPFLQPVPNQPGWYEVHQWAEKNKELIHRWGARSGTWNPKGKASADVSADVSAGVFIMSFGGNILSIIFLISEAIPNSKNNIVSGS